MQGYEKLAATIDREAAEWDACGCYAVIKDGETVVRRVFGYADRETGAPMTEQSTYCVTQYAPFLLGLCLLRLADEKKLRLSDTLDRFIPEYRHAGRMTLLQMVRGESGVPDYTTACLRVALEKDVAHKARSEEARYAYELEQDARGADFAEVLALVNDMPLECEPGAECRGPSDTVNVFLAEVICRVTGMPLFESERTLVFEPLGMHATEGDCADTATAGRIRDDQRVPLVHGAARNVFTIDLDNLIRLGKGLAKGALLTKAMWRQAKRYSGDGVGVGFEQLNGADGAYVSGPYGYSLSFGFSQKTRMCYFSALCEAQLVRKRGDAWFAFRLCARREVEAFFQTYTAPRFVRVNKRNVWQALDLTVAPEQEAFVLDAKSSIAVAAACRDWKPLVLTDQGRALGLLVLNINKKKAIYEIGIVLIDRRFQGKGYGRFMLRYAVDELKKAGAKRLEIGVNRYNAVARHLYESVGFSAANVYDDGVNMRMEL